MTSTSHNNTYDPRLRSWPDGKTYTCKNFPLPTNKHPTNFEKNFLRICNENFSYTCNGHRYTMFEPDMETVSMFSLNVTNGYEFPYEDSDDYYFCILVSSTLMEGDQARLSLLYEKDSCNSHEYGLDYYTVFIFPVRSYCSFTQIIADGDMTIFTVKLTLTSITDVERRMLSVNYSYFKDECQCEKCFYWYKMNVSEATRQIKLYFYQVIEEIILSYHSVSKHRTCTCEKKCSYYDPAEYKYSYYEKYWRN